MKIIEPQHNTYEPEYRYLISNLPDLACKVFISGQVNINIGLLKGNKDDTITNEYLVKLKVGPYWKKIRQIVPQVSVTGFSNVDSDDDDEQKWQIRNINYILIPTIFQNVTVNELELNKSGRTQLVIPSLQSSPSEFKPASSANQEDNSSNFPIIIDEGPDSDDE